MQRPRRVAIVSQSATSFRTGQRLAVWSQSGPFLSPPRPGLTDSVADASHLQRGWPGLSFRHSSVRLSFVARARAFWCKRGDTFVKKNSHALSSCAKCIHRRAMALNQSLTVKSGFQIVPTRMQTAVPAHRRESRREGIRVGLCCLFEPW